MASASGSGSGVAPTGRMQDDGAGNTASTVSTPPNAAAAAARPPPPPPPPAQGSRNRAANRASASGSGAGSASMTGTLDDVMRAPSALEPDVVVLAALEMEHDRKEVLDPKEDLWLSSADGRYNSPIIPVRVGEFPHIQTFHIHKHILMKSEWFRKTLSGEFREKDEQAVDLPEEDPAVFHFIVAYLYEERYTPIRPIATVLVPDLDKGKGKEVGNDSADSDSDSTGGSLVSDSSARSRRRRERRRRHEERHFERLRQKHPGMHRPGCYCPQCMSVGGPPCWHCAAPRVPPPGPMPPPGVVVVDRDHRSRRTRQQQLRRERGLAARMPSPPPPPGSERDPGSGNERIRGEDMRTWLLTYELNIDVYICANKFLMEDFKDAISRCCIDMLETAGSDAAQPEVLRLCKKLHSGVRESDPLLKMIFARVGFLQPLLWKRAPEETNEFLVENAHVAALILRETASRREEDYGGSGRNLPPLERGWFPPTGPTHIHGGPWDPYGHPNRPPLPHPRAPRVVW